MAREIVSPMAARLQSPEAQEAFKKQVEEAQRKIAERRALVDEQLHDAVAALSPRDLQLIRRNVALAVPDKPMTGDELQMWLDERVIGVARYMLTGRVLPEIAQLSANEE